jgi:hypothetical protein
LSLTCKISGDGAVEWFLTRESGRTPPFCEAMEDLLKGMQWLLEARRPRSVFVVKVIGGPGKFECLVAPCVFSTVEWFEKNILPDVRRHLQMGRWDAVVHTSYFMAWRRRFGNKEGGDEFRCLRLRRALCRFGGTVCLMQSETYGMRVPHGFDVHVELFPRVKEAFLGGTYNILVSLGQEQVFVVRY